MSDESRVVVVTGASAGLGRAIVREFASKGWRVAALARGNEALATVDDELSGFGVGHLVRSTDVADWDETRKAAQEIENELGPVDVWVNNAMTSVFSPFMDTDIEDFERATAVDYLGFVHGTRAALEHMVPRNAGVVVQVSSALAFRSIPLQSAYCGSKHAIVGFTEALRTELMHDKRAVQLTMVHMPAMNTPQFGWVRSVLPDKAQPVAPVYQPEVGARAVYFAAEHPQRRDYFVGMSTVLTVLGNRVAPGLLDRYLARSGYKAQQSNEPDDPGRPDNLYQPVEGDRGAHGRFDEQSHGHSAQFWLTAHRRMVAAAAGIGGVAALAVRNPRVARAVLGRAAVRVPGAARSTASRSIGAPVLRLAQAGVRLVRSRVQPS